MFATINLQPSGYIIARADVLGVRDEEVERVNENRADPLLIQKVSMLLSQAATELFNRPHEGRPC